MKPNALLVHGDARFLPLADSSVQCVVTSPPYWGLRDYGVAEQIGLEPTPDLYVAHLVAVFREVRRVLRNDGTCWLNLGDSYVSSGDERAYGSSDNGTGRGPGTRRHDVPASGLKPKDLVGIPWRVAFALQADGWWLRSDIIWAKPNPMPESITDRPTKAHEYLFLLTKAARYYYDAEAVKELSGGLSGGGFSQRYADAQPSHGAMTLARPLDTGFRNRRSVWTIATEPYPEAHFATFPEKLVEPCILAGTKLGDHVLDPFAGSGTTVAVAERLGRVGIGIELKPEYLTLAQKRTRQAGLL